MFSVDFNPFLQECPYDTILFKDILEEETFLLLRLYSKGPQERHGRTACYKGRIK